MGVAAPGVLGRNIGLGQAKLSMGNVNPPKHGTSVASQHFVDKLAELSGDKIRWRTITRARSAAAPIGAADPAGRGRFRADHDGPLST
jgi:hypothetical protein